MFNLSSVGVVAVKRGNDGVGVCAKGDDGSVVEYDMVTFPFVFYKYLFVESYLPVNILFNCCPESLLVE